MVSLFHHLAAHAQNRPDATALLALRPGGTTDTMTYAALAAAVGGTAEVFRQHLPRPAVVPLLTHKSIDGVVAMLGLLAAGSAFAVMNRKLKAPQLNAAVAAAAPPFGIVDADHLATLAASADEPFARLPWLSIAHELSPLQAAQWAGLRQAGRADVRKPCVTGDGLPTPEDTAAAGCCLFTSGSTGSPKGVLIAADDLCRRAEAEAALFGLTPADVLLNVLPLSFDVGLNQLLSSLVAGATLVLGDSWLPADVLRATARFAVTGISGVPAVWNDLLQSQLRFDTDAAHRALRFVAVSGGDLPVGRLGQLATAVGHAGVFKTYGQSETFRSAALTPDDFAARPASVGRAFGGAHVYVLRPDGVPAAADEEGEIVHTGLGTMLGYLAADAANLRPNPCRGAADPHPLAVFTGDHGRLDADGFLYVHGRRDAMLKIAGNRVYPKEVVDQLLALDGVGEAEVVGRKNAAGDTQLVAFVTPTSVDVAAVRRQLMKRVPNYMLPHAFVPLDALPRTATGKVDRPLLMQHAATQTAPLEISR